MEFLEGWCIECEVVGNETEKVKKRSQIQIFSILLLKFEFYPESKGKTFQQGTDMMRGSTESNVL